MKKISPPFIIIISALVSLALNTILSVQTKSWLFSISALIKDLLVFSIPFLVFALIFQATSSLSTRTKSTMTYIFLGVIASNFLATFSSQLFGHIAYQYTPILTQPSCSEQLKQLVFLPFKNIISCDVALFLGCILPAVLRKIRPQSVTAVNKVCAKITHWIFTAITHIIPVFIFGFLIKLAHEKQLSIAAEYASVIGIVLTGSLSYILLLFLLGTGSIKNTIRRIKDIAPALINGFSTMSSSSTIPILTKGLRAHSPSPQFIDLSIPSTINIHLIGDCFAIPTLAFAIMKTFDMPLPDIMTFLTFTGYFVLAKFSVAGVPGGGVLVMLPIIEKCFNFSGNKLSLIVALYILFDPIITCVNILGNSALSVVGERFLGRRLKSSKE